MASEAQREAAFNRIYPEIIQLAHTFVPGIFQAQVDAMLHSDDARRRIMQMVVDAFEAAGV